VMLRESDCHLPGRRWGRIDLAASAPRAGRDWTDDGTARQARGLKHRAQHETRSIPSRPSWSRSSAPTSSATAPPRTGGSSAPHAAASSRTAPTAPTGPPPAPPPSPPPSTPPRWPAAPTTCGTPPSPCG
jgi:hypothetical protein